MAYSEVPVAVLCYGNVTFNDQKDPNGKVPAPVHRDQKWFDHNIDVHEAVRYFYWTNSSFRLDTKFKYLFVTRQVDAVHMLMPTATIIFRSPPPRSAASTRAVTIKGMDINASTNLIITIYAIPPK